jgi:hypothetical protein
MHQVDIHQVLAHNLRGHHSLPGHVAVVVAGCCRSLCVEIPVCVPLLAAQLQGVCTLVQHQVQISDCTTTLPEEALVDL